MKRVCNASYTWIFNNLPYFHSFTPKCGLVRHQLKTIKNTNLKSINPLCKSMEWERNVCTLMMDKWCLNGHCIGIASNQQAIHLYVEETWEDLQKIINNSKENALFVGNECYLKEIPSFKSSWRHFLKVGFSDDTTYTRHLCSPSTFKERSWLIK